MPQSVILASSLVSLPVIGYLLLLMIARLRGSGWRAAFTHATVGWGVVVILISELLSRPHWLSKRGLALAWLTIDLVLAVIVWRLPKRARSSSIETAHSAEDKPAEDRLGRLDKTILAGAGLILLLTGITALAGAPNHGDVMSYHLPRIVFWLQNRSVEFFPTNDGRHLHQPPGAEYAVMQFHALWGGDRFDGMIQWGGYALSAVIASLVAWRMGANRRAQILAAVFCVTMPHSITAATNGKNDCVAACLLIAMVYYLFSFRDEPSPAKMLGVGASLGLALLTKGTIYFFAPPLLLALALTWPKKSWIKAMKYAPAGVALALALNVSQWSRNYQLSGSPVGPDNEWGARFGNDRITPAITFANILKNCALHLRTPSEKVNNLLERGITKIVAAAGADVNDPSTNWGGRQATFSIPYRPVSETYAANIWHFLLVLVTLGALLFSLARRRELPARKWESLAFALGLLGAFAIFCAILRWQAGGARFHIPLFVLWSVPVVMTLTRAWAASVIQIIAGLLLLLALPWAVNTSRRSMLPNNEFCIFKRSRMELYLASRLHLLEPYVAAAEAVKKSGCSEIGIASELDLYEYPMLVLLGAENGDRPVKHAHVNHASKIYLARQPEFRPCAVICLNSWKWCVNAYEGQADSSQRFQGVTVFISKSGFSP
ncbi:MAG: ArnT family glycosyltransferase [Blastocatellales bacterium]